MKPKLVIVGAAGRMGRRILSLCKDDADFDIIAAVENKGHPVSRNPRSFVVLLHRQVKIVRIVHNVQRVRYFRA